MKPKSQRSSKPKKATSKILKPAVPATTVRRALKNVIKKEILPQPTTTARNQRAHKVETKGVKENGHSTQRGTRNSSQVNNHDAAGGSQKAALPVPPAKRQKTGLLEIPNIPTRQGTVFVIGENDVGQLGLENVERKLRPAELKLKKPIVDIVAGGMHSVCLTADGDVYTFGCNDEGALGRETTSDDSESPPDIVNLPERIVMISAGDSHTAALSETGKVFLWGNFRDSRGSMGLTEDRVKKTTPVRILPDLRIVKISSGVEHLACLSEDGDVYTCGCAETGALGRITLRSAPDGGRIGGHKCLVNPGKVQVSGKPRKFDNIWTGHYATYLHERLTKKIFACGLNNHCQLGYSHDSIAVFHPHLVKTMKDMEITKIDGGLHHTLILKREGSVYVCGRKEYGRLGLGDDATDAETPTIIPRLEDYVCCDISASVATSFAVDETGSAFSWGMGDNGQLGLGSEDDYNVPTVIEGRISTWNAFRVSAGGQHTLLLAESKR